MVRVRTNLYWLSNHGLHSSLAYNLCYHTSYSAPLFFFSSSLLPLYQLLLPLFSLLPPSPLFPLLIPLLLSYCFPFLPPFLCPFFFLCVYFSLASRSRAIIWYGSQVLMKNVLGLWELLLSDWVWLKLKNKGGYHVCCINVLIILWVHILFLLFLLHWLPTFTSLLLYCFLPSLLFPSSPLPFLLSFSS